MIGFRRPPETEDWKHGLEADVKTPHQQYLLQLREVRRWMLIAYAAFLAVFQTMFVWIHYQPHGYPRVLFWRAALLAARDTLWVVAYTVILLPIIYVVASAVFTKHFVWDRMRANIRSPGWPSPNNAQDPQFAGETYDESRNAMWDDEPEPAPREDRLPIVFVDENGDRTEEDVPLPKDGGRALATFLHSVMGNAKHYSRAGAMDTGYTRSEWETLEAWTAAHEFHVKGQGELTTRGRRWAVQVLRRYDHDLPEHPPTEGGGREGAKSKLPSLPSPPFPGDARGRATAARIEARRKG